MKKSCRPFFSFARETHHVTQVSETPSIIPFFIAMIRRRSVRPVGVERAAEMSPQSPAKDGRGSVGDLARHRGRSSPSSSSLHSSSPRVATQVSNGAPGALSPQKRS